MLLVDRHDEGTPSRTVRYRPPPACGGIPATPGVRAQPIAVALFEVAKAGLDDGSAVIHVVVEPSVMGYVETIKFPMFDHWDAAPILGGIALVENFRDEIAHVEGLRPPSFTEREPELLERAYEEMATLPVDEIDLLVVDGLGKEISGAEKDTNVISRYRVLNADDPESPDIKLIYARGLTEKTRGNGNGIGLADITRRAAIDRLDLRKTYANALTSGSLAKAKHPVVAPDDELAFRISLSALGGYDPETVRIVWIRNTEDLAELRVSAPLVDELPEAATVLDTEALSFEDSTRSFDDD